MFLFNNPVQYIASELNSHDLANKLEFMPFLKTQLNKRVIFIDRLIAPWELIDPDALNIIDYLERHEDYHKVGGDLIKCQERLKTGVAIVCLQKNEGAELARGGNGTMQKAALVLNLELEQAQIKKTRYWSDPRTNPRGMKINFKLIHGVIPEAVTSWYRD